MVLPGLSVAGIVIHGTGAADGQRSRSIPIGQLPLNTRTAGSGARVPAEDSVIILHLACGPGGIRSGIIHRGCNIIEGIIGNRRCAARKCDPAQILTAYKGICTD